MKSYYKSMNQKKGLKVRAESLCDEVLTKTVWTPLYLSFTQNGLIVSANSPMYDFQAPFVIKNI